MDKSTKRDILELTADSKDVPEVDTHKHIYIYTHAYMKHIYKCMHICVHTCTYTCISIHTHTHTHMNEQVSANRGILAPDRRKAQKTVFWQVLHISCSHLQ